MRYEVRIGKRRAKSPARDLYGQPYRYGEDDGARIVHVGTHRPPCPDCGRGRLEWAEAGFVAWHRICSHCGSHWQLFPLPDAVREPVYEEPTCRIHELVAVECEDCDGDADWCEQCEGTGKAFRPHPERRCNRAAAAACMGAKLSPDGLVACACRCHVLAFLPAGDTIVGHSWKPAAAYPDEDDGQPTWEEILGLLQEPFELEEPAREGDFVDPDVVPVCWARRAQFF